MGKLEVTHGREEQSTLFSLLLGTASGEFKACGVRAKLQVCPAVKPTFVLFFYTSLEVKNLGRLMEVATWNVWGSSARLHSRLLGEKKKCQQFAFCLLQIKVISTQRVSPAGGEHPKYWGVCSKP